MEDLFDSLRHSYREGRGELQWLMQECTRVGRHLVQQGVGLDIDVLFYGLELGAH